MQDRTADKPPQCSTRTLICGLYELLTEPPSVPRLWACAHPECAHAIRRLGDGNAH
jgi:hypothetical protein